MRHLAFLALNISFYLINPLLCNQSFISPPYTTQAPIPHAVLTYHMDPPSSSPLTSHYHPPPLWAPSSPHWGSYSRATSPPNTQGGHLPHSAQQHPCEEETSSSLCLAMTPHMGPRSHTEPRLSPLSLTQAAQPLHAAQAKLPHARLSPVWISFSSHADTSILPWATTAHQPPRPPTHTHTHSTFSAPSNGFCTSCSGRRKKGKEEEEKRPQLTLVEETVIILSHHWSRPWIHAYWMVRKCSTVIPQIPWISFLWVVVFFFFFWEWERKRESKPGRDSYWSLPKDLVKRNVSLLIISRELISLQRKP